MYTFSRCLILLIGVLVAGVQLYGQQALLSAITVKTDQNGCFVLLQADKNVSVKSVTLQQKKFSVIKVTMDSTTYGLTEYSFDNFPEKCPLHKILVMEEDKKIIVELVLTSKVFETVRFKQKTGKIILPLSREKFDYYEWNTSIAGSADHASQASAIQSNNSSQPRVTPTSPVQSMPEPSSATETEYAHTKQSVSLEKPVVTQQVSPTKNEKANNNTNVVNKVTAFSSLKRGSLEEFVIATTTTPVVNAKRIGSQYTILIENSVVSIKQGSYELDNSSLYKSVIVQQKTIRGNPYVGFTFTASSENNATSLVQIKPKAVVIHSLASDTTSSQYRLSLWSSQKSQKKAYDFIPAPHDSEPHNKEIAASNETTLKRLVAVSDRIAVFAKPLSKTPVDYLRLGTKTSLVKIQGNWKYVRVDESGMAGWVDSKNLVDSASLNQIQWNTLNEVALHTKKSDKPQKPLNESMANPQKIVASVNNAKEQPIASSISSTSPKPEINLVNKQQVVSLSKPVEGPGAITLTNQEAPRKMYSYRVYGKDPFLPLSENDVSNAAFANIESCVLVGVLLSPEDRIALVENQIGESYTLRENDKVLNGKVLKITERSAVFLLYDNDFSRKFMLKLIPKHQQP